MPPADRHRQRTARVPAASGRLGVGLAQEVLKVEPPRVHRQPALGGSGPLGGRPVPVELDAVAVGVTQVERLLTP
jgi:hypothetical protein